MSQDPFDEIIRLIETAAPPFPVTEVRRLILRATSRATVTAELAEAIDRLNASILVLAVVMQEFDVDPIYSRQDALNDASCLRIMCRRPLQ